MNQSDSTSRGIPLNAFFLLIASCAVILAMIGPMVRGGDSDAGEKEVVIAAIIGSAGLCILGIVLGVLHYRRIATALLGAFLGLLIGVAFGLVLFIPSGHFPVIMLTAFFGSLLVLGLGVAIRWSSEAKWPLPSRKMKKKSQPAQPKQKRHPLDPDPEEDEMEMAE